MSDSIGDFQHLLAFFRFLIGCLDTLRTVSAVQFYAILTIAVICGVGCFWLTCIFGSWWNLKFHRRVSHYVLGALSGILVMLFILCWAGVGMAKQFGYLVIDGWSKVLPLDADWSNQTFIDAYRAVAALKDAQGNSLEDFSADPPPEQGGHKIPTTKRESKLATAIVYADAGLLNFRLTAPFLTRIAWANSAFPQAKLLEDVDAFFKANPGGTYELTKAIDIVAEETKKQLIVGMDQFILWVRITLPVLFLLIESAILGAIAFSAQRDLKPVYA